MRGSYVDQGDDVDTTVLRHAVHRGDETNANFAQRSGPAIAFGKAGYFPTTTLSIAASRNPPSASW